MNAEQVRNKLRATLGLTVGEQVAAYVLSMLDATPALTALPILAQDARTGTPVRRTLEPSELQTILSPS
jgi:hypothetical protein